MTSTIVQPGAEQPVTVVQGEGLPVVVVLPQPAPVLYVEAQPPPPTPVVQTTGTPVIVVNPVINGGGGGGGGGYDPTTFVVTSISVFSRSHTYPYLPGVRLIDDQNAGVDVHVEYPDSSHVYIEFPVPFTGTIILS